MVKPGHEQPEFDNRSYADDTLFSDAAKGEALEPQAEADSAEAAAADVKPVAEIMAEHEQRIAERATRWQELTGRNWPPGRIEQTLDAEFPDLKSPERIEAEELKREAAERRHARNLHGTKKQRTKRLRFASPRDAGPPPHIAEDVRRAQGLIE